MKLRSVMSHQFSQVPKANIQRSSFNRNHGYKTTFNAGKLIPVFLDEALPGDTMNCKMTAFARMSTPLVPFMDNLMVDSFFFAVPYRLVWNNWQKFNGEQVDPGDSTDFTIPQIVAAVGGHQEGSLSDYFGIPTEIGSLSTSSLFHRAYNLIWNEWFRDQNLQDSVVVDKDDGPDTLADYLSVLPRGKRHDYFTSCLPFPQKGDAVSIPLGTEAPVYGHPMTAVSDFEGGIAWQGIESVTTQRWAYGGATEELDTATVGGYFRQSSAVVGGSAATFPNNDVVGTQLGTPQDYEDLNAEFSPRTYVPPYADLSAATAATINSLRQAFQIQKLYERDARGGTRYTEIIKSHFGVISPDARLQRPEYLGGGTSPVNVSPIAQTSATGATGTPQGNLAAIGTFTMLDHGFVKSFSEHCLLIGLVSVRADLNYQQGLNRMFSRSTRWDFYWPALAHLGEQSVLNKEIYAQGPSAINGTTGVAYDEEVFGYQERYAEYRYKPSVITGLFRSSAAGTLDLWHLAQDFAALPELNEDFIVEDPPMTRVLAVDDYQFLFDAYFNYKCARPMPVYSVPGLIDHF